MKAVRVFAQYQQALDARTEVPPFGLLPYRPPRKRPYLYTLEEIRRLLEATTQLQSTKGLRPHTYYCLLGLLAVSGLRISEALALLDKDVDLQKGILTISLHQIQESHDCSSSSLYRRNPVSLQTGARLAHFPRAANPSSSPISDAPWKSPLSAVLFIELSRWAGLRQGKINRGPRLHDFRHRFAVQTMIQWYRCWRGRGASASRTLHLLGPCPCQRYLLVS